MTCLHLQKTKLLQLCFIGHSPIWTKRNCSTSSMSTSSGFYVAEIFFMVITCVKYQMFITATRLQPVEIQSRLLLHHFKHILPEFSLTYLVFLEIKWALTALHNFPHSMLLSGVQTDLEPLYDNDISQSENKVVYFFTSQLIAVNSSSWSSQSLKQAFTKYQEELNIWSLGPAGWECWTFSMFSY